MKKIGTISSAAGLIFLGIWMILNKTNSSFADELFKWWPAIIIIMGIEVLVYLGRKSNDGRIGFSFLIIPVILIFIFVNISQGVENKININFNKDFSFNNMIEYFKDADKDKYKIIDASKTIEAQINTLNFNTENASVNVKKSVDGKVKLDLEIYVAKNEKIEDYNIKEIVSGQQLNININEKYIKKVSGDIYLPDACNIFIDSNNLKLNSSENFSESSFKIDSDNSLLTLNEAKEFYIDSENISIELKKADRLYAIGNNGRINVNGSIDNLELVMDNGKVDIINGSGKNVKIKLNDGIVNYKTRIDNAEIKLGLDNGICNLNGERRVNSGITKKIGNGESKININVDNGTLSFTSQEW